MSLIIDMNVLISFVNEKDERRQHAVELLKLVKTKEFGTPYLLDYVFDEFMTLAYSKLGNKKKTVEIGKSLLATELELLFSTERTFQKALELFEKTSGLSFTDCVIAAVALETGASVMTFDEAFKQVKGLKVIS